MLTVIAFVIGFYLGVALMSLLAAGSERRATEPVISIIATKESSVRQDTQTGSHRVFLSTNSHR